MSGEQSIDALRRRIDSCFAIYWFFVGVVVGIFAMLIAQVYVNRRSSKSPAVTNITPAETRRKPMRVACIGGSFYLTNVVDAFWHTNDCMLVRWAENGVTNEFHAWNTTVSISTIPTRDR
jgi:hypothetical protein